MSTTSEIGASRSTRTSLLIDTNEKTIDGKRNRKIFSIRNNVAGSTLLISFSPTVTLANARAVITYNGIFNTKYRGKIYLILTVGSNTYHYEEDF